MIITPLRIGAAILAATTLMIPAVSSTVHAVPSVAHSDARSDAAALRTAAISLRSEVNALLQTYLDTYAERFTPKEVSQLTTLQRDADRQMAAVVTSVSRLRTAVTQGKSTTSIASARSAAMANWARAKSSAEASWATARTIVEPKLSLFERLGALNDYNAMMSRFDALGSSITTLASR